MRVGPDRGNVDLQGTNIESLMREENQDGMKVQRNNEKGYNEQQ